MIKEFSRKAQGAMEFMVTYGWAFVVVLVMVGSLSYFWRFRSFKYDSR